LRTSTGSQENDGHDDYLFIQNCLLNDTAIAKPIYLIARKTALRRSFMFTEIYLQLQISFDSLFDHSQAVFPELDRADVYPELGSQVGGVAHPGAGE